MKYDEITPAMRAFIGNREMMRRLGFCAEDIFCQSARSARNHGVMTCFLVLRTAGGEFSIECGPVRDADTLETEYAAVLAAVNSSSLSDEDLGRIFSESEAYRMTADLIAALKARGFVIPTANAFFGGRFED